MIKPGETGELIPVDDADALGDALLSLVENRSLRVAMGEKCREHAARRFEARENAKRLFEFVRSRC
jgi:glycosyltransferase involved in cell wall biosynthesis